MSEPILGRPPHRLSARRAIVHFLGGAGLVLLFGSFSPLQAQLSLQGKPGICGSWNNYCQGGTTYSAPTSAPADDYYTTPRGRGWYCKATASNGGWGWGESQSKSRATGYALSECRTRGRGCAINYCSLNGGAKTKQRAGPSLRFNKRSRATTKRRWGTTKRRSATTKRRSATTKRRSATTKSRRGTVSASLCYRKLVADVGAGRASARVGTYVSQALAGYANCKRKSFGSTAKGDNYARKISRKLARGDFRSLKKSRAKARQLPAVSSAARKKLVRQKRAAKKERGRIARVARAEQLRADLAAAPGRVAAAVNRGDYKAAVTDQALVLAANKTDPKAWQDFSTYLEKSGRVEAAVTAIARAALLSGRDAASEIAAIYGRDAAAKAGRGDMQKAIAQQAMAVKTEKNNPKLWRQMGDYMAKNGQLANAATALRRARILGGPDPETSIFQMYQSDALSRAEPLESDQKVAIYRSHLEKYSDQRGNLVRHRLAQELLKQKRTAQAREVYQQIASLDLRDSVAQKALRPVQTAAGGSTFERLQEMQREMTSALVTLAPAAKDESGGLGGQIDEIAGGLTDALQQMEALQKSLDQDQPAPGKTFEIVVPTDKAKQKPEPPTVSSEQPAKPNPQKPSEEVAKTAMPAKLTPGQKQQQITAAREQWKVILFHYKNAKEARAKARQVKDPSMKHYYTRLAQENVNWAQGMTQKLNRTLAGSVAPDVKAANALRGKKITPIKTGKGTAYGQALHLSGQGPGGKKGAVRNLIDGSDELLYAPPPVGANPKVQGLFGIKQPIQNAPSN
ncbi:MAG: hypothetical protein ACTSY1_00115 [Alphaproteobacteria bacterium]